MRFKELVKSARPFALAGLAAASLAMGDNALAADFCHKMGDTAGRELGRSQISGGSSSLNGMVGQILGKVTATVLCGEDEDVLRERQREAERLAERKARDAEREAKKVAREERDFEQRVEREVEARMRAKERGQNVPSHTARASRDIATPPVAQPAPAYETAGPAPVYEAVRKQVVRVESNGEPLSMQEIARRMEEDMRRAHEEAQAKPLPRIKI